jgi:hypothetical protein
VERAFNKLARMFASQMEALKRYRTGGEQKLWKMCRSTTVGRRCDAVATRGRARRGCGVTGGTR